MINLTNAVVLPVLVSGLSLTSSTYMPRSRSSRTPSSCWQSSTSFCLWDAGKRPGPPPPLPFLSVAHTSLSLAYQYLHYAFHLWRPLMLASSLKILHSARSVQHLELIKQVPHSHRVLVVAGPSTARSFFAVSFCQVLW